MLPAFYDKNVKEDVLKEFGSVQFNDTSELGSLLEKVEKFLSNFVEVECKNAFDFVTVDSDGILCRRLKGRVFNLRDQVDRLHKFFKSGKGEENLDVINMNEMP